MEMLRLDCQYGDDKAENPDQKSNTRQKKQSQH